MMAKSDDSSDSDSSAETNKRMPDDDYPAFKFELGTASEKSLDASHFSEDAVSERGNQLSDVGSEMESEIIDRISNENSETGSTCTFENFNLATCSSPQRDLIKNMDFGECIKRRTQSAESSKSDQDVEKNVEVYRNYARRSSGSLSPRLAYIRRRESIEGFTQEELSHEHEVNDVQKIDEHISGTHISTGSAHTVPAPPAVTVTNVVPFKRADFACAPGSPKRCNKFITRPGVGNIDVCPSPTRHHHRRAESPLCSSRVKRRYASETLEEPKRKRASLDGLNMELRSHKQINARHALASGSSAFTSTTYICSGGESCGGSVSEISTPSPPHDAHFHINREHGHVLSNLVRDFDQQSDYSNTTTPLHTPVNSRRGSHESILSTDSRDQSNISSILQHKASREESNMDCDNL